MATSGSIDFKLVTSQIARQALNKIGAAPGGQVAIEAPVMTDAITELNLMLKSWQKNGPNIWRETEGSITLVSGTHEYTLTPKPFDVTSARYTASGIDTPLQSMTRSEYYSLPNKTSSGRPTGYYFEKQRDEAKLFLWPVPSAADQISYTYQRIIEDSDEGTNDIDLDQEWFETVIYGLAARLIDTKGMEGDRVNRIIARAEKLYQEAMDYDRPEYYSILPEAQ